MPMQEFKKEFLLKDKNSNIRIDFDNYHKVNQTFRQKCSWFKTTIDIQEAPDWIVDCNYLWESNSIELYGYN